VKKILLILLFMAVVLGAIALGQRAKATHDPNSLFTRAVTVCKNWETMHALRRVQDEGGNEAVRTALLPYLKSGECFTDVQNGILVEALEVLGNEYTYKDGLGMVRVFIYIKFEKTGQYVIVGEGYVFSSDESRAFLRDKIEGRPS
jgi:hypothetical protein